MLAAKLVLLRAAAALVCLLLTGAAVLVPEHAWLQLLASAACAAFGWVFGIPVAAVIAQALVRMRPERLAAVIQAATSSMPPAAAKLVLDSLRPPPVWSASTGAVGPVPPPYVHAVPIVFEGESEPPAIHSLDQLDDAAGVTDGWESPPAARTPAQRPPRKN